MIFVFFNNKIEKKLNGSVTDRVETDSIITMLKSSFSYYKKDNEIDLMYGYQGSYVIILTIFIGISILKGFTFALFVFFFIIFLMILPKILIHKNHKTDILFDNLFLIDKNNNKLNFMIVYDNDYIEIKKYFLSKCGKNLDEVEKVFSVYNKI